MNLDRAYHADVVAHEAVVGVHHEDEDRDGEADSRLVEAQPHRGLATPHGCSRPAGLRREGGGLTAAAHGDGNLRPVKRCGNFGTLAGTASTATDLEWRHRRRRRRWRRRGGEEEEDSLSVSPASRWNGQGQTRFVLL